MTLGREGLGVQSPYCGLKTSFFAGFWSCKKAQSPENNPQSSNPTYLDYLQGKNAEKKEKIAWGGATFPHFPLFWAKNVIFGQIFFL